MAIPNVDAATWPIVVITFDVSAAIEDVPPFLDQVEALYLRGEPFVTIADVRRFDFQHASAIVRKAAAEGLERIARAHPGLKRGEATVVRSAAARALNTAFNLMRQRPYPCATFTQLQEAVAWCAKLLGR